MAKNTAIVETPKNTAIERPDWVKESKAGTEALVAGDIRPPALRLAQGTSPEVKRANGAYIEGLAEGDFWDSSSKEIYGEGPLELIVVVALGHRHIEFEPFDEGGGVIDMNVKDGDPRTEFTTKVVDGKEVRCKPVATKFYDYLVYVTRPNAFGRAVGLRTFSLKGTCLRLAEEWNEKIANSGFAAFAWRYSVASKPKSKGALSWHVVDIRQLGFAQDKAVYDQCEQLAARIEKKQTKVVVETVNDDEEVEEKRF